MGDLFGNFMSESNNRRNRIDKEVVKNDSVVVCQRTQNRTETPLTNSSTVSVASIVSCGGGGVAGGSVGVISCRWRAGLVIKYTAVGPEIESIDIWIRWH